MTTEIQPTTKTEKLHQFTNSCLQEDIDSLRGFPLKETSITLGLSCLMLLMAALHLFFAACQFALSLIATAGDLLVKVLVKIMPTPKESEVK